MGLTSTTIRAVSSVEEEYRPFPVEAGRNARHETLEVPLLVRALALPIGQRMLEVGCGGGIALVPFARLCRPARLVGLDIDQELLSHAERHLRERRLEAELYHGDVRRMPFPNGSFDIVVDFGTLYHIARAGDALREIVRILSPDGLFVHETRMSQLVSHPRRSFGRTIPWPSEPALEPYRTALLWTSRRRRR